MKNVRDIRKLLHVRALQRSRLERAVQARQAALDQAKVQVHHSEQEHAHCAAAQADAQQRRAELLSRDFVGSDLESIEFHLGVCARATGQAAGALEKARTLVSQQSAALDDSVRCLDRNAEQRDQLKEELQQALLHAAELAEEAESDEAGEQAAARISARRRAANAEA